jgi:hypothetical protein
MFGLDFWEKKTSSFSFEHGFSGCCIIEAILKKNFRTEQINISIKKGLSNEPTFGLIHLAGQYL